MNITLQMLIEFISNNYDILKSDYNKLSKDDKAKIPLPIYLVIVFDKLLTAQQKKNEQTILDESATPTQVG